MAEKVVIRKLDDNLWTFNEANSRDAYLITGTERAALIDALWDENDLFDRVRDLTSLPVDVLITHGHGDHAGKALKDFQAAGCALYLNDKDFFLLWDDLDRGWFSLLEDGMVFDLGGCCLETIALAGHTPGGMVFLERTRQFLFTGDGTGAGVFWMQLPGGLPLRELRKNLGGLWETVKDMESLKLHPGHRHQAPVQLGRDFLADTILLTDKIISGELIGRDMEQDFHGCLIRCKTAAYKLITDYRYRQENI
jgi:glyoxylase-like metal-dependent hydrolase (beta-lactamase superfamily II)